MFWAIILVKVLTLWVWVKGYEGLFGIRVVV